MTLKISLIYVEYKILDLAAKCFIFANVDEKIAANEYVNMEQNIIDERSKPRH